MCCFCRLSCHKLPPGLWFCLDLEILSSDYWSISHLKFLGVVLALLFENCLKRSLAELNQRLLAFVNLVVRQIVTYWSRLWCHSGLAIVSKVCIDQLVFTPIMTGVFYVVLKTMVSFGITRKFPLCQKMTGQLPDVFPPGRSVLQQGLFRLLDPQSAKQILSNCKCSMKGR